MDPLQPQDGIDLRAAEPPLVLAHDVGSSSSRTMLFDARARRVLGTEARAVTVLRRTPDGGAEIDPLRLANDLASCVDATLARAGERAADIRAVAGATLVTNVLGLDAAHEALSPLFTYADRRSTEDAGVLRAALDEDAVHQRTGCMLRASYLPALLAWLRRTQPELWRRTRRWASFGEFFLGRVLDGSRAGPVGISHSAASWSGLLDRRRLCWDTVLLAHLRIEPERLGAIVECDRTYRGLAASYARRWPALEEAVWLPQIGDGAAANLGSGGLSSARPAITIGTTGAMRVLLGAGAGAGGSGKPVRVPRGLWAYRADAHRPLLGGAVNEGGNVFAWLTQRLQLPGPAALEAALAALEPDAHGLTVLPFLAGERSPGWAADARGMVEGLRLDTQPLDLVRALLEAIAYRFALVQRLLEAALPADGNRVLVASGGALLASPAWMQILADVLDRPVVACAELEPTARGAALVGLRALGAWDGGPEPAAALGARHDPVAARHARYLEALERHERAYRVRYGTT